MTNPEGDLLGLRRKAIGHLQGDNPYMSDYYKSFLLGAAFGPVYSMPVFGGDIINLAHGKHSSAASKAGTATGMAFAFAHDVYAKARGLGTIAEGRLLLMDYGKPVSKAVIRSVPLLPAAYVAAASVSAKATYGLIESVAVGTQVGNKYSPKPFWLPLPLWSLFQ